MSWIQFDAFRKSIEANVGEEITDEDIVAATAEMKAARAERRCREVESESESASDD